MSSASPLAALAARAARLSDEALALELSALLAEQAARLRDARQAAAGAAAAERDEVLLTVGQYAEEIGCARQTVWRWAQRGVHGWDGARAPRRGWREADPLRGQRRRP